MEVIFDEDGHLRCPVCGNDYTHLESLISFERLEDAETKVVALTGGVATVVFDPSFIGSWEGPDGEKRRVSITSNPSSRRHAFALLIECENGCLSWLAFAQHKGVTEVSVLPAVVQ